MKVLFLATADNTFILEMAKYLKDHYKDKIIIDIVTRESDRDINYSDYYNNVWVYKNNSLFSRIPKIRYIYNLVFLKTFLKDKDLNIYDICHIHFLHTKYRVLFKIINNKCSKIIISFWGNDFYNSNWFDKLINKKFINESHLITFSNMQMKTDFIKRYGDNNDIKILGGRTGVYGEIQRNDMTKRQAKEYFSIPINSIAITCGYSPKEEQQHLGILESIHKNQTNFPNNIFLIFPMTYKGADENIKNVNQYCKEIGINYKLFQTFLTDKEVAILRKASDIMIMAAKTDQFSLTMLEYFLTENTIITGSWLPYKKLDDLRIIRYQIDTISDVGNRVLEAINDWDNNRENNLKNAEIIQNFLSANNPSNDWIDIYNCLS
jgi:hypothetical protein